MTEALTKRKSNANALQTLALRLCISPESLEKTLKATAFRECKNNEDFMAAVIVANAYNLNPFLGQIYVFPSKRGGVVPMVPIDGWIQIVQDDKRYNGVKLKDNFDEEGKFVSVTAAFYLKEIDFPIEVTEYLSECQDLSKETWKRWPKRMLRHKAYSQGARVAFGISGIYEEDEATRIVESITAEESQKRPDVLMPCAEDDLVMSHPEHQIITGDIARGILMSYKETKTATAKKDNTDFIVQSFDKSQEMTISIWGHDKGNGCNPGDKVQFNGVTSRQFEANTYWNAESIEPIIEG